MTRPLKEVAEEINTIKELDFTSNPTQEKLATRKDEIGVIGKAIDELRGSLFQFVRNYDRSVHSSLKGMSPMDRSFSEPELINRLPDDQIEKSFLLEIERRVSTDCVITIDQVEYEVDHRFAKQRITLRYTPDMNEIYVVGHDGTLTPIHLLNKHDNALIKRDKVRLTGGDD